jgi:hypothetical protein
VTLPSPPSSGTHPVDDAPAASKDVRPTNDPTDVPVPTPAERVKVTFTLLTEGAKVTLVHDQDARELPMLPITVAFDPHQAWTLHAKKPGFCELVRPLDLQHGPPAQRVDIELKTGCP